MIESRVSAILLASGLSERMGGRDKLLLTFEGKTLLQRAVELLDSFPFYEKILVTTSERFGHIAGHPCFTTPAPAWQSPATQPGYNPANGSQYFPPRVKAIMNPNPNMGQSGSLRLGLEAASGDWYLFLAADQPLLTQVCLQPLFFMAASNTDRIIFPSINTKPCSPTLFPAFFRDQLMNLTGDTGGRAVREAHPESCLTFEAANPMDFLDIDNDDDYRLLSEIDAGKWKTPPNNTGGQNAMNDAQKAHQKLYQKESQKGCLINVYMLFMFIGLFFALVSNQPIITIYTVSALILTAVNFFLPRFYGATKKAIYIEGTTTVAKLKNHKRGFSNHHCDYEYVIDGISYLKKLKMSMYVWETYNGDERRKYVSPPDKLQLYYFPENPAKAITDNEGNSAQGLGCAFCIFAPILICIAATLIFGLKFEVPDSDNMSPYLKRILEWLESIKDKLETMN